MDERFTPTGKKFAPVFSEAMRLITDPLKKDQAPTFDEMKYVARLLIKSRDEGTEQDLIEAAFAGFKHISEEHEGIEEKIRWSLLPLLLAVMDASNEAACAAIDTEQRKLKSWHEENLNKSAVTERARAIATEGWLQDENKEIKTGEMANKVWSKLIDEGFSEQLPENIERVRVWIRGVAPDYAKAKGRPKKRSA